MTTTLGDIHANNLLVAIGTVLAVTALYIFYCAVNHKEINIKALGILAISFGVIAVTVQDYYYNNKESKVINRFNSGEDIICKFNENSNIVLSKKRGYKFKNRFFIKDEMAIKLDGCYLLE